MAEHITQQELETYLWDSATLLRGSIDAGDYKQYIFPLLFYKRICDVYDEEYAEALADSAGNEDYALNEDNHRFQIPKLAHWNVTREKTNNIGKSLQLAFRAIEKANQEKLHGIFGDAPWTNKNRLPDELLKELIEHFSSKDLSIANCPEDELGRGYEYLIKKFADDSGHTAQEFYTNRTVVHLMTEMLDPQPGESIYDPACGSAGMLISTIAYLKEKGHEWRNVKLYGQELNHLTSAIGRMNVFLHGVEDFQIVQGDTLAVPAFLDKSGKLMCFDMVLANPPYSIKQWNRDAFSADPYGRNFLGTPPQGRADYAFLQHILMSLNEKTGRCAVLFPHGVLFRNEEAEMRKKLVELDFVECVLGLGKNLFYNSPMEACIMICRTDKPKKRKNKVLFINAVHEVTRKRAQSFLDFTHIEKIAGVYHAFEAIDGFSTIVDNNKILQNEGSLSIPLYIGTGTTIDAATVKHALTENIDAWQQSSITLKRSLNALLKMFSETPPDGPGNGSDDENEEFIKEEIQQDKSDQRPLPPPAYLRALLAAEIVYQNYQEARFGSVKLEKLIYLCDAHFDLGSMIDQHYSRQAAGPYDPKGMRSIRDNLLRHKWFAVKKVDNRATKYLPMENCGQHREAYKIYYSEHQQEIQNLLDCMKNWKTQQCEIVATLYSAWADFLAEGIEPRDEQVINEVLVNWNESKLKIPVERWRNGLKWMKQNGLYPGGNFGKEVEE